VPFLTIGACFIHRFNSHLPIWYSYWIPTLPNFIPEPCLPYFSSSYPLVIADLIHLSSLTWRQSLLQFLFPSTTVSEILKIRLQPLPDSIIWTPSTSRAFSTKLANHHLSSFVSSFPSPLPNFC
jgi:hypothetical protein